MEGSNRQIVKDLIGKKIAGDIVYSPDHGAALKKWRKKFRVTQRELAVKIGIMPSVISDYESSRRKSPGIRVVKRLIDMLMLIDEERGGKILSELATEFIQANINDAIVDMQEVGEVSTHFLDKKLGLKYAVEPVKSKTNGYVVLDAYKAITNLSYPELIRMFSIANDAVLIITNVNNGRTTLPIIKLTGLRPATVVLLTRKEPDELAIKVAESMKIGLATSALDADEAVKKLRKQ